MKERPAPTLDAPETAISSHVEETAHGPIWMARATYSPGYRHGRIALETARRWAQAGLALVARDPAALGLGPEHWVVLDVESTGLGARAGTYAFLVGLGRWDPSGDYVVEQFLMRDPADEPALLSAVSARLQAGVGLLTFNGKAFDLPLLGTRWAMQGARPSIGDLPHCDLLHAARRIWPGECRLVALEQRWLGVRRGRDVAGRDVPDVYLDYLRGGAPERLDDVLRHNRADLLSLLLLAAEAAAFPARAAERGDACDRAAAARLYAAAGDRATAAALYDTCLDSAAPAQVRQQARLWLADCAQRQGHLDAACRLWQAMLEEEPDLVEPYAALAKALEHRLRDPARALAWVETRLQGASLHRAAADAFAHRRARLARKVGGLPQAPRLPIPCDGATSAMLSAASLDGESRTLLP